MSTRRTNEMYSFCTFMWGLKNLNIKLDYILGYFSVYRQEDYWLHV